MEKNWKEIKETYPKSFYGICCSLSYQKRRFKNWLTLTRIPPPPSKTKKEGIFISVNENPKMNPFLWSRGWLIFLIYIFINEKSSQFFLNLFYSSFFRYSSKYSIDNEIWRHTRIRIRILIDLIAGTQMGPPIYLMQTVGSIFIICYYSLGFWVLKWTI